MHGMLPYGIRLRLKLLLNLYAILEKTFLNYDPRKMFTSCVQCQHVHTMCVQNKLPLLREVCLKRKPSPRSHKGLVKA